MADVMLGSAILTPVNAYNPANDKSEERCKVAFIGSIVAFLVFIVACAGDCGLIDQACIKAKQG